MIVEHFSVGPLGCNCVIVGDEVTKEAIVVDPGGDGPKILTRLAELGLTCKAVIHTHTHFDHVGSTHEVVAATNAPAMIHEGDLFLYEGDGLQMQLNAFGLPFRAPAPVDIDRFLVDGDAVRAGDIEAGVLHTPGHTPGSLCFLLEGDRPVLIAGDTLFQRSIGRSDLWGGDGDQLIRSIHDKILTLPDETLVITGHGATTTVGEERSMNPFLRR